MKTEVSEIDIQMDFEKCVRTSSNARPANAVNVTVAINWNFSRNHAGS